MHDILTLTVDELTAVLVIELVSNKMSSLLEIWIFFTMFIFNTVSLEQSFRLRVF